jgi:hypothetical protein
VGSRVWIEFVGNPQGIGLKTQAQKLTVAFIGTFFVQDSKSLKIPGRKRHPAELLRL